MRMPAHSLFFAISTQVTRGVVTAFTIIRRRSMARNKSAHMHTIARQQADADSAAAATTTGICPCLYATGIH
jgi:hypothetical protein